MFIRIFKYSVKNTLRNKFLSISSVMVLTLLMFFINVLFLLHDVSTKVIQGVNEKLSFSLYLNDEYDENTVEVIGLMERIQEIDPNIKIEYKSKEKSLDAMRLKEPDLGKVLERTNPLPNTIMVSDIGLEEYEDVNKIIENKLYILSEKDSDIEHFSNYTQQYKKIVQVTSVLQVSQLGIYIIMGVFSISIAIIIYSVISNFIFYYKDEIYITRLVGGSKKFIYGPFVLQGIIYSFFAWLFCCLLFLFAVKNIAILFGSFYAYETSIDFFVVQLFVFILIGASSGFLSSRRYLR